MKVAIIGSRTFNDYELLKRTLNEMNSSIELIVSGGAVGADKLGEKYAYEYSIPTLIFIPDWETFGRYAGFLRNKDIVDNCDRVIAFWDGKSKGTDNSISYAKKIKKEIIVLDYSNKPLKEWE
jgi:hypothetical protein